MALGELLRKIPGLGSLMQGGGGGRGGNGNGKEGLAIVPRGLRGGLVGERVGIDFNAREAIDPDRGNVPTEIIDLTLTHLDTGEYASLQAIRDNATRAELIVMAGPGGAPGLAFGHFTGYGVIFSGERTPLTKKK